MDKGDVTALTLLDLSAAFDTFVHATSTDRLSDWYGISGQAQIWSSSYLKNRHQYVQISQYTTPLSAIIFIFDLNHNLYDDDTQLNLHVSRPQTARTRISNPVSGGQCHLNHLTILRRFFWPSLAYMCTKVA